MEFFKEKITSHCSEIEPAVMNWALNVFPYSNYFSACYYHQRFDSLNSALDKKTKISFTMRNALDKDTVREIYNRTAKRYDLQHTTLTARSDEKGRRLLIEKTVQKGDKVLDAGAGTGCTALLAAKKVGPSGRVVLFDLSENMLAVARKKMENAGLQDRAEFKTGDILNLPFEDGSFDVVFSTYSLCPVVDPSKAILELYRLVKPAGLLGIAHSAEPDNPLIHWLAEKIENIIWRFPLLSLGCRAISVLPALEKAGAKIVFYKKIGVPLWPFLVFVVQKPK